MNEATRVPSAPAPERNSALELLRIVAMLLIIAHHLAVHGNFARNELGFSTNAVLLQFLLCTGKIGVDCFVLISGYFLIAASFRPKKLLLLLFEVFCYSATIFFVMYAFGSKNATAVNLLFAMMPVSREVYWFISAYVILYCLSPFLNVLVRNLDQRSHAGLAALLLFLWCIEPTFLLAYPCLSNLGWFATLYLVAAYIRLYPEFFDSPRKAGLLAAASLLFIVLGDVVFLAIFTHLHRPPSYLSFLSAMNSLPVLVFSLSLFVVFLHLHPFHNRIINTIAGTTLGIYLLHDNFMMRDVLWTDWFQVASHAHSPFLFLRILLLTGLVFLAAMLVDLLRILIIERLFKWCLERAWPVLSSRARRLGAAAERYLLISGPVSK